MDIIPTNLLIAAIVFAIGLFFTLIAIFNTEKGEMYHLPSSVLFWVGVIILSSSGFYFLQAVLKIYQ